MSSGIRYTEEFKRDAVTQVTDRGYSVKEVADRLGISTKSLYDWKKQFHSKRPVSHAFVKAGVKFHHFGVAEGCPQARPECPPYG